MQLACCGSTYHYRQVHTSFLQLFGHVHHLFKTWCNQSAKTYHINVFLLCLAHYLVGRHHHAHIYHIVAVTSHHHAHNVLSYVVNIAFYGGKQHFSC